MKYRLTLVFLISLLFASFSFNCLHYDALIRAEKTNEIDSEIYSKLLQNAYDNREEG
jgi:hypothetical protein